MATTSGPSIGYATEAADGEGVQRGQLEGWLRAQKDAFFGDLSKGSLNGWTVVMGNEAGGGFGAGRLSTYLTIRPRLAFCFYRFRIPVDKTPVCPHHPYYAYPVHAHAFTT